MSETRRDQTDRQTPTDRPQPRLVPEVAPPRPRPGVMIPLLVTSSTATFAAAALAVGLAASAPDIRRLPAPAVTVTVTGGDNGPGTSVPDLGRPALVPAPAEHLPEGADVSLVTEFDGRSFAILGPAATGDGDALPPHGEFRLVGSVQEPVGAIAEIEPQNVPERYAGWKDLRVRVEEQCSANVRGFALLSPMRGSVGYMSVEPDPSAAELIDTLLGTGDTVIAAELDDCHGRYARASSLPPAVSGDKLRRPELASRARQRLLASSMAARAQRDFARGRDGVDPFWKLPYAEIDTTIVRHPRTRETFVSVQAVADYGCGGASINLWGLYRLGEGGELETVRTADLGEATSLDRAVDIDGDGRFEWLATMHLGDAALLGHDGRLESVYHMPLFGCPC